MSSAKLMLLLVLLYAHCCSVFPQSTSFNISGFVKEKITGEPLVGTNIIIYKDSLNGLNPPYSGAASNNFGFYVIPKIPQGRYVIIIRHIGFRSVIKEVEVAGKNLSFNIEMLSEEIKLDEVLITGEKEDRGSISKIDVSPELLAKLPSLTGELDLFRLLQMLPGVKAANELSSGLYIRGGSPDQTLTLIDGVMLYNPAHLGNIASTFNSNAVRDIKLIKGAFPAQYGGRLSSVIDIKLRSGTKEREKGIIGLGLINSFFTVEGPLSDKATYMVSGRGMYYDALQRSFSSESSTPRYNFYDINFKVSNEFSENNIISISGIFNKDKVYNSASAKDIDYDIQWENSILSFNWLHVNSRSLMINTSFNYIDYKSRTVIGGNPSALSPTNYFASSILTDLNLRQDVELHWDQDHTFKTGLELSIHNYDLLYSDMYNSLIEVDPYAGFGNTALEGAIYFQNESQLTPLLKINIGGRIYYLGENKYFNVEPRISASYALTEDIFIKAGYASAHQFLHLITKDDISLPTDLWYPSTSKTEPAKSTQYVFGVDNYFMDQEYLFTIETYYKKMNNLNQFSRSPVLDPLDQQVEDQFVTGEGEAYGLELFINKRSGDLSGWVGYTLSWTKRKFSQLNGGKVFYPRYDRRNDVSVVLAYELFNSITFGLTWIYATGERFTLPPGQYLFENIGLPGISINLNEGKLNESFFPDYHKMDINFTYKFQWLNSPFEIYMNLYNVYNRQNPFAQYLVIEDNSSSGSEQKAKLKRLTLFPFIPTIGFNFRF